MLPIPDPDNHRLIYTNLEPGRERQLYRKGDLVYKTDNVTLGENWRRKMEDIINHWQVPSFVDFIPNGYITRYIDGHDLHGNIPFSYSQLSNQARLTTNQKIKVLEVFYDAIRVGKLLGFTFGDITCGNILLQDNDCYLIDYDSIVEYPTPHPLIWENTLKLVFS